MYEMTIGLIPDVVGKPIENAGIPPLAIQTSANNTKLHNAAYASKFHAAKYKYDTRWLAQDFMRK
jgi:hypothetical protein